MGEVSGASQISSKFRSNLRWDDLSLSGRCIARVLFFLVYLGPSHAMSTTTNYPWHLRLMLYFPWFIIGLTLLVPSFDRIPVNPHICGLISVFICTIIVDSVTHEWLVPEWGAAVAIAGLAALLTGPMLRGYDKADRDREAIAKIG